MNLTFDIFGEKIAKLMEGGGRFEGRFELGHRRSSEDFGRDTEARVDRGSEGLVERENPSWLSEFVNPARLGRYRQYPALEGRTSEWIIMEALLARLVEQGPEMNPAIRARLSNLVGILRMAFFPNMNQREQEIIHDLVTKTTTVDFSALQYEVTPETREDVQWIWRTFGLGIPSPREVGHLPAGMSKIIAQLDLSDKSTLK